LVVTTTANQQMPQTTTRVLLMEDTMIK